MIYSDLDSTALLVSEPNPVSDPTISKLQRFPGGALWLRRVQRNSVVCSVAQEDAA
jgi:hypothetical protein